jgi:DNA repair ATPase RecN
MELGTRELVQFLSIVATLAASFAVVKSQLSRVIEDLKAIQKEMHTMNDRIDTIESGSAVFKHQVNVLGNILSPPNLDRQSREIAQIKNDLEHLQTAADRLYKMHNGSHPET